MLETLIKHCKKAVYPILLATAFYASQAYANPQDIKAGTQAKIEDGKGAITGPATVQITQFGKTKYIIQTTINNPAGQTISSKVEYQDFTFKPPAKPTTQNNINIFLSNLGPVGLEGFIKTQETQGSLGYLSFDDEGEIQRAYTTGHIFIDGKYKGQTFKHRTKEITKNQIANSREGIVLEFSYNPNTGTVIETFAGNFVIQEKRERPHLMFKKDTGKILGIFYDAKETTRLLGKGTTLGFSLENPIKYTISQSCLGFKKSVGGTIGKDNLISSVDAFQIGGLLLVNQIQAKLGGQEKEITSKPQEKPTETQRELAGSFNLDDVLDYINICAIEIRTSEQKRISELNTTIETTINQLRTRGYKDDKIRQELEKNYLLQPEEIDNILKKPIKDNEVKITPAKERSRKR